MIELKSSIGQLQLGKYTNALLFINQLRDEPSYMYHISNKTP